jgi:hypothetical protein
MTEVSPNPEELELIPGSPEYEEAMRDAFDKQLGTQSETEDAPEDSSDDKGELPDWVPEKFRKAADPFKAMADAYAELERKASQPKPAEKTSEAPPAEAPKAAEGEAEKVVEKAGFDFSKLQTEYAENGDLTAETRAALVAAGIGEEMINGYIAGQQAIADQIRASAFDAAGGEEAFQSMTQWASENLSPEEIDAFNDAVSTGDKGKTKLAVQGLRAAYEAAGNAEPKLLHGRAAPASDVYRSTQELTAAMRDPRYKNDPAYQADVRAKLARSNLF